MMMNSSSPSCWSQAQEKSEGWRSHLYKTTHIQNPHRNTTHIPAKELGSLQVFRGRTPGLISWAVPMNNHVWHAWGRTGKNVSRYVHSAIVF
ncbi:unnamed protein product [Callosobruchus maculatus]|uniref:Uncharacterized protein n=1 Tax=Callosobruchus maculatus TaxID=64391 RepID=A0A653CD48_CALMS|nr:unnamed protein product [Callosobruchus maculatus]